MPKLLQRLLEQAAAIAHAADVGLDCDGFAAARAYGRSHGLGFLAADDIRERYIGAVGSQSFGDGPADTARSAGNQGHLVF